MRTSSEPTSFMTVMRLPRSRQQPTLTYDLSCQISIISIVSIDCVVVGSHSSTFPFAIKLFDHSAGEQDVQRTGWLCVGPVVLSILYHLAQNSIPDVTWPRRGSTAAEASRGFDRKALKVLQRGGASGKRNTALHNGYTWFGSGGRCKGVVQGCFLGPQADP